MSTTISSPKRSRAETEAPRNRHPWKETEVKNLRYLYEIRGLDYPVICDILGRNHRAIQKKVQLKGFRRPIWYAQELGRKWGAINARKKWTSAVSGKER